MNGFNEKRSETRTIIDRYYSVEFSISGVDLVHQYKIWDISLKGMCVLMKKGSAILEHIQVGDILNMKYYTTDSSKPTEYQKTEIKHITKDDQGRFKGHYLIGISVLEEQNTIQ